MPAHCHGQVWNASEFARSFGVADTTIRRYLDLLTSTFVVRQLQPWTANIKKRQVRSPKVYISDSGLLHALLDIETSRALRGHPKVGPSWAGFMPENVIQQLRVRHESVESQRQSGIAKLLPFTGLDHTFTNNRARQARRGLELLVRYPADLYRDVDAVEQWTAEARMVALELR